MMKKKKMVKSLKNMALFLCVLAFGLDIIEFVMKIRVIIYGVKRV